MGRPGGMRAHAGDSLDAARQDAQLQDALKKQLIQSQYEAFVTQLGRDVASDRLKVPPIHLGVPPSVLSWFCICKPERERWPKALKLISNRLEERIALAATSRHSVEQHIFGEIKECFARAWAPARDSRLFELSFREHMLADGSVLVRLVESVEVLLEGRRKLTERAEVLGLRMMSEEDYHRIDKSSSSEKRTDSPGRMRPPTSNSQGRSAVDEERSALVAGLDWMAKCECAYVELLGQVALLTSVYQISLSQMPNSSGARGGALSPETTHLTLVVLQHVHDLLKAFPPRVPFGNRPTGLLHGEGWNLRTFIDSLQSGPEGDAGGTPWMVRNGYSLKKRGETFRVLLSTTMASHYRLLGRLHVADQWLERGRMTVNRIMLRGKLGKSATFGDLYVTMLLHIDYLEQDLARGLLDAAGKNAMIAVTASRLWLERENAQANRRQSTKLEADERRTWHDIVETGKVSRFLGEVFDLHDSDFAGRKLCRDLAKDYKFQNDDIEFTANRARNNFLVDCGVMLVALWHNIAYLLGRVGDDVRGTLAHMHALELVSALGSVPPVYSSLKEYLEGLSSYTAIQRWAVTSTFPPANLPHVYTLSNIKKERLEEPTDIGKTSRMVQLKQLFFDFRARQASASSTRMLDFCSDYNIKARRERLMEVNGTELAVREKGFLGREIRQIHGMGDRLGAINLTLTVQLDHDLAAIAAEDESIRQGLEDRKAHIFPLPARVKQERFFRQCIAHREFSRGHQILARTQRQIQSARRILSVHSARVNAVVRVQSTARGFLLRRQLEFAIRAARRIQKVCRGFIARKRVFTDVANQNFANQSRGSSNFLSKVSKRASKFLLLRGQHKASGSKSMDNVKHEDAKRTDGASRDLGRLALGMSGTDHMRLRAREELRRERLFYHHRASPRGQRPPRPGKSIKTHSPTECSPEIGIVKEGPTQGGPRAVGISNSRATLRRALIHALIKFRSRIPTSAGSAAMSTEQYDSMRTSPDLEQEVREDDKDSSQANNVTAKFPMFAPRTGRLSSTARVLGILNTFRTASGEEKGRCS